MSYSLLLQTPEPARNICSDTPKEEDPMEGVEPTQMPMEVDPVDGVEPTVMPQEMELKEGWTLIATDKKGVQ